mgnify:CR=1 FL=1
MIAFDANDGQLTLTINRPEKANALTELMLGKMADIVTETDTRVLILTGVGNVFSAGADFDDVRDGTLATSPEWERLSTAVANFAGLSIAAINGACVGGALGMVLACDLRISVPNAKFFYPIIKMGVLPQPSDPVRLHNLIGPSATKLILLTGAQITAVEALRLGLIDRISPLDLMSDVQALTAPARGADPAQICAIKALIK